MKNQKFYPVGNRRFSFGAFTLIELLVVISIIGLLAGIVLVSIKGVREKARIAKTLEFSQSIQSALGAEAVGIWSFDEGPGNTTAKDSSGYGNNGTIKGGATFISETPHKVVGQGSGKYALSFDGVDDYVDVPQSETINSSGKTYVSVEFWLKASRDYGDEPAGADQYIIYGSIYMQYNGWNNCSQFQVINDSNVSTIVVDSVSLPAGEWHHFAGVLNGTVATMYKDGKSVGTPSSFSGVIGTSSIGARIGGPSRTFNGVIDEVRIYSRALTLAEVQKHYVEGLPEHKGLANK